MNNLKSSEPINLLGNIEMVIELSENSRLSDEFYEKAKPYIDVIKSHLQLSDMAALFFSIFVDNDNSSYTSIKDLSQHLDCRKIRIMQYGDSLHELEKRRLIRCRRRDNEVGYRVPSEVFYALTEERAIEPWQNSHLSQEDFFSFVNDLFKERKEDEILYPDMVNELKALVYANPNLELCKIIRKSDYAEYEKNLLLYFCNILVNDNEDQVIVSELESIFEKGDMSLIKMSLRKDNNRLLEDKWIEKICFNGFSDGCWFKLTDKAKQELVGEEILQKSTPKLKKNIIQHNTIVKKELFFDEYEQEQIDKLTVLLRPHNFTAVQKRLLDSGMRNGFACLFHGLPGTGKTETVYQIARQTGRNILPVNVSEIKSKWIGETEKNIKILFEDYRELVSKSEVAPILLFNEADALLGTRLETLASIDKMENALQNIILQEMENLNGIMIATTNLTKNLDNAFERRFIYKIKFLQPSVQAKKQIWRAMLSHMPDSHAEQLAVKYDFSGGQIENIVRKSAVEQILSGGQPSLETIMGFCRTERLKPADCRSRIGFI